MSKISFSFVYRILNYTNSRGIDSESLLNIAGIDLTGPARSYNKISVAAYFAVLNAAIRQTKDPYFGLHMGEFFELKDLSHLGDIMNLGSIMASCRDLGQAMEKASEYLCFIGGPFDSEIIVTGHQTEIIFIPRHPGQLQINHVIDEALSSFITIIRSITEKFVKLKEVRFPYSPPDDIGEYKRIFSCPVAFNQTTTALVFNSCDIVTPIVSENVTYMSALSHSTTTAYENIDEIKEYSRKISRLLHKHLQEGSPCIKRVAKELGMSIRCLQMKLSREGETFSQIVKNVRKDLAKTYLIERDYSIDEITYLLGFSDPSVFHRAFKNWTGVTPGQFRNAS